MRRFFFLVFVVVCLVGLPLAVAACGGDDDAAAPAPEPAAPAPEPAAPAPEPAAPAPEEAPAEPTGEPLIIGAAIAETGFVQPYDLPGARTGEFAAEDLNAAGGVLGRPVQIVTADMKSDPAVGPTAALELIEQGAELAIVSCDFDFGSPAALTFQEAGIVAMSICAGAPQFGPQGIGPLAFSNGIATPNEAAGAASFGWEQGWRNVYVLEDTTIEYTVTWVEGFNDTWAELGGEVVLADTFANPDPSIASQITRLQGLDPAPDAIILCTYSPGGPSAIRQIRAAGIDLPIQLCVGMDGNYWLDAVPDLSDTYVTHYGSFVGDDQDEKVNELYRRYEERYGEPPPQAHFMMGYSAVQLLALGAEKAGTTEGTAVAAALETLSGEAHFLGPTTFTEEFHISLSGRPVAISQIQNGEFSFVTRLIPEYVPPPRIAAE